MTSPAATRWGIMSAGKISHDFVTCLRSLPEDEHKVLAVGAKNFENAKKFAQLHKIENVYDNYEDVATNKDIDVIYVGSINPQHYAMVKMILENNKPVLCEKPMTMTYKQTKELVDLARSKGLFLMEAIWSRFQPLYRQLVEQELSKIGEVQQVQITFGQKQIEAADRVTKAELGGSSILDIGIYCINFAQMVFDNQKPEVIKAVGQVNASGVDTNTAIILRYPGGKVASFTTSVTSDLPCEALAVGREGSIKLHKHFWCTNTMETPSGIVEFEFPPTVVPCNYGNSSGLRYEAMHVRECLLKGLKESPIMPLKDTLIFSEIMTSSMEQIGVKIH